MTQITSVSQTVLHQLPPGIAAPIILTYSASTVPVLQLGMKAQGMSEQELFDLGWTVVHNQMATVAGAALPYPYGGKTRQVSVNLDIPALQAKGLSPVDVINAISAQNLVLPSGSAKLGPTEYNVEMNGSTETIAALNDLPIRTVNGATIYVRDVASVSDGFSPQINIVRMDGMRGILMAVYKSGSASTLDVVSQVYAKLPLIKNLLPPQIEFTSFFDQSIFVRAAVQGVIREGLVAACLTALMILLFLGSWRSTLIIAISIPLSIMVSIAVLSALHETINLMTLGGLALAVGILVDDATVVIENIERNLAQGKDTIQAILDGSQEIAIPALVSTLCICIVFVPMFFLTGVAKFLFVPLGGSRRFRDARFLLAVANSGAHDGDVPAQEPSRRGICDRQRYFFAHPAPIRYGVSAHEGAISKLTELLPRECLAVYRAVSAVLRRIAAICVSPGSRFFPQRGFGIDPPAHARPRRATRGRNGERIRRRR